MPVPELTLWIGTRKGAFAFSTRNRKNWKISGPHFRGWEVNHVSQDSREPKRMYAAVNSAWFGPHIHASTPFSVSVKDEWWWRSRRPGAFRTLDGLKTWTPFNGNVRADF